MILKNLKVKNIRSYKSQEIEFPQGSTLFAGDIGSGKTSTLLAIEYALFGLQPGQKGSSLLRVNSNLAEVSLEFLISGKTVLIERQLKRSSKGISNDYASITIDGEKTESSITEIKSKVIELLGYPREFIKKNNTLYRYTVYSPQEQMKQIILDDSEKRLNVLRQVFGIDKYRQIKQNTSLLLTNLRSDVRILQSEIRTLDEDKNKLSSKREHLKEIELRIKEKTNSLKEKSALLEGIEEQILNLNKKLTEKEKLNIEIEKTQIIIATRKETINTIFLEIGELKKALQEIEGQFNPEESKKLEFEIRSQKEILEELNARLFDIGTMQGSLINKKEEISSKKERIFKIDICPTCLQDVPENHKHNILNETERSLSEIKNNLAELSKSQESLAKRMFKLKQVLKESENKKINLDILKSRIEYSRKSQVRLDYLEKNKDALQKDVYFLSKHLLALRENMLKYTVFENQLRYKQIELKQAELNKKGEEIMIAELNKEDDFARREISQLQETIKDKEKRQISLNNLNELIGWLSSSFLSLIDLTERTVLIKVRNEFSQLFRKWFVLLVIEDSFDSRIDENFTPIIIQNESEIEYEFLSGGERTAVALAYRLALNQTINSVMSDIKTRGLVILDEPTEGFSEAQIIKMRDIFEEINTEQLIIVSHEQKIEGFVDNIIRISKTDGLSNIEQPSQRALQEQLTNH